MWPPPALVRTRYPALSGQPNARVVMDRTAPLHLRNPHISTNQPLAPSPLPNALPKLGNVPRSPILSPPVCERHEKSTVAPTMTRHRFANKTPRRAHMMFHTAEPSSGGRKVNKTLKFFRKRRRVTCCIRDKPQAGFAGLLTDGLTAGTIDLH